MVCPKTKGGQSCRNGQNATTPPPGAAGQRKPAEDPGAPGPVPRGALPARRRVGGGFLDEGGHCRRAVGSANRPMMISRVCAELFLAAAMSHDSDSPGSDSPSRKRSWHPLPRAEVKGGVVDVVAGPLERARHQLALPSHAPLALPGVGKGVGEAGGRGACTTSRSVPVRGAHQDAAHAREGKSSAESRPSSSRGHPGVTTRHVGVLSVTTSDQWPGAAEPEDPLKGAAALRSRRGSLREGDNQRRRRGCVVTEEILGRPGGRESAPLVMRKPPFYLWPHPPDATEGGGSGCPPGTQLVPPPPPSGQAAPTGGGASRRERSEALKGRAAHAPATSGSGREARPPGPPWSPGSRRVPSICR